MAKVRNLSDIQQEIAFTEFDFYQRYVETFKTSELGRIKSLLPLREMAISFGLIEEMPKSIRAKRGRKSFFTPEGKVALAFLKMYTGLSVPKLMEALNGNIHYQIFCVIRISPENQLTNYKLMDSILLELSKTLKMIMRQLALLGKILGEIRRQMRIHPDEELLNNKQLDMLDTITKIYRQQKNHFNSGDSRESIPNRIVSVSKPYIRPIFRGKETKIETSFSQKARTGKNEVNNATKRELARVRTTAMEGSSGTQKEHYGLRKIAARIKSTEILLIFFGIHTANVVNLTRREAVQVALAA